MKETPVSVDFYILIPFYNDLEGLLLALQSIHYKPNKYAILIIDDGSTEPIDESLLLPHFSPLPFVKIIRLPHNQGITAALNCGLQWLRWAGGYKYIARLDCGDICAPDRFYRQVNYLDTHTDTGLVGSWCVFKDFDSGFSYVYKTPTRHRNIQQGMHFRNLFIHPTVMWRDGLPAAFYPYEFPHAEDYGLFYKMIGSMRCAVLPEKLVTCRINPKGLSLQHRRMQLKSRIKVVRHFGSHSILTVLGVIRLKLLLLVPHRVILAIKGMLYS